MICRNVQILTKNVRLISRSISARGFKKIQALDPPVKQLLERLTKVKISTNRHSHVPAYTHAFIHALIRTYINSHIPKKKKGIPSPNEWFQYRYAIYSAYPDLPL